MVKKKRLVILASVLFILFIYFSYIVHKGNFDRFDFDITVKLQDRLSPRWELPFSILSLLGSIEITGMIWLGIFIYTIKKRYYLASLSLFLFFFSQGFELLGKLFIFHPGPPHFLYRGVEIFEFPRYYIGTNYSYPSGHIIRTVFLVTVIYGLFLLKKKFPQVILIRYLLMFYLFFMIISRIYLGEHWTSDVIGGLLLGLSSGLITMASYSVNSAKKVAKNMLR